MIRVFSNQKLQLSVRQSIATSLSIRYSVLKSDGSVSTSGIELYVPPLTNRSANLKYFSLPVGAVELISVSVKTSTLGIKQGQCFVTVAIVDPDSYTHPVALAISGYLCSSTPLVFPGTPITDSLAGPGYVVAEQLPLVSSDYALVYPANTLRELLAIFVNIVIGGASASRGLTVQLSDGSAITMEHKFKLLAATGVVRINASTNETTSMQLEEYAASPNYNVSLCLPNNKYAGNGSDQQVTISPNDFYETDEFECAIVCYREWILP
jgi:hypothetical protein